MENISKHAHKAGSWYLLRVKISEENPRPFYMEVPPGIARLRGEGWGQVYS